MGYPLFHTLPDANTTAYGLFFMSIAKGESKV